MTPQTAAHQASMSIINFLSLFKLTSIESVMLSNHLILCCPLLLPPPLPPSIRVFSNESALHIRPEYWSFSFNISPFKEYSGLISLRISFRILSYILLITPLQYSRLEIPWTAACQASLSLTISWSHPTISSSVVPFSSCLQSFLASGSFLMSQLFASGGQRIGASASASVLAMNI